jgi:hypothetical protein
VTAPTLSIPAQARRAGFLYVLVALTGPIGLLYVPSQLFVAGDAGATADRIRASEWLLRVGVASDLVHQIIAVFLVLALYRLFKAVDEALARQMVIFGALLSVPIVFVIVLNWAAALVLVSDAPYLATFDRFELDALAYVFVQLHGHGIAVASIFWGVWLFPFGLLVIRSGFVPQWLGVLLIIAGSGYLVNAFGGILLPQSAERISQIVAPLQFGELPIIIWLATRR